MRASSVVAYRLRRHVVYAPPPQENMDDVIIKILQYAARSNTRRHVSQRSIIH